MYHRRQLLTFVLTIFFSLSYGQEFAYPSIRAKGQNITDFIPAGWAILDSSMGDLNKDGIQDAAIIFQLKDSVSVVNSLEDTVLAQPRILAVLFRNNPDNSFLKVEQNNTFILKHDNPAMDDPFEDLAINRGVLELRFRIFYNMGSWYVTTAVHKFRYQQKQFVLIGADKSSFHRATQDFENYSYNFLTGKRSLTIGSDQTQVKKTTWKAISVAPLKTLRTFLEPFSWEIEEYIYL